MRAPWLRLCVCVCAFWKHTHTRAKFAAVCAPPLTSARASTVHFLTLSAAPPPLFFSLWLLEHTPWPCPPWPAPPWRRSAPLPSAVRPLPPAPCRWPCPCAGRPLRGEFFFLFYRCARYRCERAFLLPAAAATPGGERAPTSPSDPPHWVPGFARLAAGIAHRGVAVCELPPTHNTGRVAGTRDRAGESA